MINKQRLLDSFLEYIQIDSETGNEKNMCDRMVADLTALGGVVTIDEAGKAIDSNGYNVYATFEGTLPGDSIIYSCHMDTVKPGNGIKPVIADGVIRSSGDTILASDDKSGIAGIIEAIRSIKDAGVAHKTFEVIFTISEEGGIKGAKNLDYSRIKSKKAVALDSSGNVGKIINQAPGQNKIYATIVGKTAHAGLAPEEGISAIQVMGHAISKMNLLRIDSETTCNIGTIEAKNATNIVPGTCDIIAEVRSRDYDKLQAQTKHIVDCMQEACDKFGATLDCRIDTAYISYTVDVEGDLVKYICENIKDMGLEPNIVPGGGGSDANIMNRNGIEAVVLGTGMSKVHTTNEFIEIKQLENTAELCYRMMTKA